MGERELRRLLLRRSKPWAPFIDAAHGLHDKALNGPRRLVEPAARGDRIMPMLLFQALEGA